MPQPPPPTRRANVLVGSLDAQKVRWGVPRGPFRLRQRRVRPRVFGEPLFDLELTPPAVHPAQPHVLAYRAWRHLVAAGTAAGLNPDHLAIHSAYRSLALQRRIWAYRLAERRRLQPELTEREAARIQQQWTARPGRSAHHTGLALDLGLYHVGRRAARRTPEYRWLAHHAARFGFFPYLPEAWHWEYNPPGLVERLRELRRRMGADEPFLDLIECPEPMPVADPAD